MVTIITEPFGKLWKFHKKKQGGANKPGLHGGVYRHVENGSMALFKQDIKDDKVRVAKVIGEGLAGSLLNYLYPRLGVEESRFAFTSLVQVGTPADPMMMVGEQENRVLRPDQTGENTYIMSVYIKGYWNDFWKYAYYKDFVRRFRDGEVDFNNKKQLHKQLEAAREVYYTWINAESDIIKKANMIKEVQDYLTASSVNKMNETNNIIAKEKVIELLAVAAVDKIERPSTVLNFSARRVASAALKENPDFIEEFPQITAPRLLLADFGVNYGNFGVAKINGKEHLVALDFGAAFSKLYSKVNPFSRVKSGANMYLNHFVEYDTSISASEAMAKAFIHIGHVPPGEMKMLAKKGINDINDRFGIEPLKKFCQRMGMKARDYQDLQDKAKLADKMSEFMQNALIQRQKSMKHQGYALLLEHCINKHSRTVDVNKLNNYVTGDGLAKVLGYPENAETRSFLHFPSDQELRKEFIDFALRKFRKMDLIVHSSILPLHENNIKEKLVTAVIVMSRREPSSLQDIKAYRQMAEQLNQQTDIIRSKKISRAHKAQKLSDIHNECERMKKSLIGSELTNKEVDNCVAALNKVIDKTLGLDRKYKPIKIQRPEKVSFFARLVGKRQLKPDDKARTLEDVERSPRKKV